MTTILLKVALNTISQTCMCLSSALQAKKKGIFIENRHVSIKLKKRGGNFMPRVAMVAKPDFTSESVVDVKPRQEYTIGHREVFQYLKLNGVVKSITFIYRLDSLFIDWIVYL
jgi:hypothetical protein